MLTEEPKKHKYLISSAIKNAGETASDYDLAVRAVELVCGEKRKVRNTGATITSIFIVELTEQESEKLLNYFRKVSKAYKGEKT